MYKWSPFLGTSRTKFQSPYGNTQSLITVNQLISNQEWDTTILNSMFLPYETNAILSIPLPRFPTCDHLIWHYSKKGIFTVKSGYKLALHNRLAQNSNGESSNSNNTKNIWKYLWTIDVPPKIRSFISRTATSSLPFGSQLKIRKISNGMCQICHVDKENWSHCLLYCNWLQDLWVHFPAFTQPITIRHRSFLDLCSLLMNMTHSDVELFSIILCFIWTSRNRFIFQGEVSSTLRISAQATSLLNAHRRSAVDDALPDRLSPIPMNWIKPKPFSIKVNVDASFVNNQGAAGIVIRNHFGSLIGAFSIFLGNVALVEFAQMLAISHGVNEAARIWSGKVTFESDSLNCVACLNDEDEDLTIFRTIKDQILRDCRNFEDSKFSCTNRSDNNVADLLARLEFSFPLILLVFVTWVLPPTHATSSLIADLNPH